MHDAHEFLKVLATVLGVAAITSVVFQRLRQPVVLGYILAGLIVGPHVPLPVVANREIVQTLSEVGVILLMFSLGLEFSLGKLVEVGPNAGLTAVIQTSIVFWLGFIAGQALGWTSRESVFSGAIVAISSTTIIARAFDEQGIHGKLRRLVVGVLIVEDLIAILLMAILTAVSVGDGFSARTLAKSSARLAAFLVGLVAVGLLVVPRAMRAINRLKRPETTLVASIGICFAIALLALDFGYSVALGAFIAGSLVAESGAARQVEHLVRPIRDMFAAIFFVSVGMLIDPLLIARHWVAVSVLTAVVIVGKLVGVSLGAFLAGNGTRTSVQAGMSLAQIGEFSFIIAAMGLSLKATGDFLYPVAVAVSALTTLSTPFLIRASGPVANWIDRKLPRSLQTFATLYGSWVERLRMAPRRQTRAAAARRLVKRLVLDAALLAALIIGASVSADAIARFLASKLALTHAVARGLVIVAAGALAVPFMIGIFRLARRLGLTLTEVVLPRTQPGAVDLAAAPRRVLVVTLQLGVVLAIGLPLLALTQPFLPGLQGALILGVVVVVLGLAFWKSTTSLQGHVKAGAQLIVEALVAQAHKGGSAAPDDDALAQMKQLLPGLGEPVAVELADSSAAIGLTLAQLDLRGITGATVLAMTRGGAGVILPSAKEVLMAGDVLALAGTHEAVQNARVLLGPRKR